MNGNPTLKVHEAYTRDVGRGTARIDYESMDALGASTGDVIETQVRIRKNEYVKIRHDIKTRHW